MRRPLLQSALPVLSLAVALVEDGVLGDTLQLAQPPLHRLTHLSPALYTTHVRVSHAASTAPAAAAPTQ